MMRVRIRTTLWFVRSCCRLRYAAALLIAACLAFCQPLQAYADESVKSESAPAAGISDSADSDVFIEEKIDQENRVAAIATTASTLFIIGVFGTIAAFLLHPELPRD